MPAAATTNAVKFMQEIPTKEALAEFIIQLKEDFLMNKSEWENTTIDRFLDAMAAWVISMNNHRKNIGEALIDTPDWSTFASILIAAKHYE